MELGFWLEYIGQLRMKRRASKWPVTTGRVENVFISTIPTRQTRYALEVAYAYQVNGEVYGNTERRFYLDASEPRQLETTLKTTGVNVHYDPERPSRSFMQLGR
jgi:hypothetical protein